MDRQEEWRTGGRRGGRRWQSRRTIDHRRRRASCKFTHIWHWGLRAWHSFRTRFVFASLKVCTLKICIEGAYHTRLLFSCLVVSDSLWPHGLQHTRLPCPSLSPGVCSDSRLLSRRCHPSHPLSSSSPALNLSQHQGLPQWVTSLHQVAKQLRVIRLYHGLCFGGGGSIHQHINLISWKSP